jgi:hypothetical protein
VNQRTRIKKGRADKEEGLSNKSGEIDKEEGLSNRVTQPFLFVVCGAGRTFYLLLCCVRLETGIASGASSGHSSGDTFRLQPGIAGVVAGGVTPGVANGLTGVTTGVLPGEDLPGVVAVTATGVLLRTVGDDPVGPLGAGADDSSASMLT